MKSSKWMIGLLAVVLVLTLAPSSFAQVQIQLFNTPSAREIETSRNAVTADPFSAGAGILVSGQLLANSSLTTTDLTLTFPSTITSGNGNFGTFVPNSGEAIRIEGAIGLFATATISTVNYGLGTITLNLPGFPPPAGNSQSGSFRIVGVRLDLANKTAPLALTSATLSSNANNYIAPTSMPTLISATGPGLASLTQAGGGSITNAGTFSVFTTAGSTPIDSTASVLLTEGFASAWRTALQNTTGSGNVTNLNSTQIRLTVAGMPAGLSLTVTAAAPSATVPGTTLSVAALTSAATQTVITITSSDMNVVETIPIGFTLTGTATSTLTPGAAITLTATMAPLSSATNVITGGVPVFTGGYPKFAQADTAAVTIGTVIAAKTTMLVPFVTRVGTVFDTGIAVANTTKDPFTTGAAVETGGPITFTLYPRTTTGAGVEATVTTSATVQPGSGLEVATGNLLTGGTWVGLLSQLMAASTPVTTGDYYGYVFIEANFLDAHGVSYIIQGTTVTSAVPMLILQQPTVTARNTALESLGF
jgi:hypothetical protein